jgi:hypothetical protein
VTLAAHHAQRRLDGGGQRLEQRRLAAAALAGNAVDFVLLDREIDFVDGLDDLLFAVEIEHVIGLQRLGAENRVVHDVHAAPTRWTRLRGSRYSLMLTDSQ